MTSKTKGKKQCPTCRTRKYEKQYFIQRQHNNICPECFRNLYGDQFNDVLKQYEKRVKSLYPKGKHPTHRLELYKSLL